MSFPPGQVKRMPAFWLASGGGVGLAPFAAGTFGTVVAVLPWLALRELPPSAYAAVVALVFGVGSWAAQRVIAALRVEDPGFIVIDEFVGLWIALFLVPPGWGWALLGFGLFRLFDIWKPWPVAWADRSVKGGFGTMLDDALAGLMALGVLQALAWLVSR